MYFTGPPRVGRIVSKFLENMNTLQIAKKKNRKSFAITSDRVFPPRRRIACGLRSEFSMQLSCRKLRRIWATCRRSCVKLGFRGLEVKFESRKLVIAVENF